MNWWWNLAVWAVGLFVTAAPAAAEPRQVIVEENGVVCIEADQTESGLDKWKVHTDASLGDWVKGFHGQGCLQFTGNNEASGPPTSVLVYPVKITNAGTYRLAIRGLEAPLETKEGDKANDCYVRMVGQPDWRGQLTKHVLLGASYKWSWEVKCEYEHHQFKIAEYELKAGVHVLQVAGRSRNFFLDRVVLYKDLSVREAQSQKLQPSKRQPAEDPDNTVSAAPVKADMPDNAPPAEATEPQFDAKLDLISLHYDHAPDQDDGHSAAADRAVLLALHDAEWVKQHTLAVSGTYGRNKKSFNKKSDAVMDASFHDLGGWVPADADWDKAVERLVERWSATLSAGGDVWVKEGGQSDITADILRAIKQRLPEVDTTRRIHVVQHSRWNEDQTTPEDLRYTRDQSHYIRIRDANRYLNIKGGDEAFQEAALAHAPTRQAWKVAFAYYDPRKHRLDFSDTGELLHILGLGEVGIDDFRTRYLARQDDRPSKEAATQ